MSIPVLFVAVCLITIILVNVYVSHDNLTATSGPFYQFCYDVGASTKIVSILHGLVSSTQPLALVLFVIWLFVQWRDQSIPPPGLVARSLLAAVLILLNIGIWSLIYGIYAYRAVVAGQAGSEYKEASWSLGQIIPLAAWIPVAIDFAYIIASRG